MALFHIMPGLISTSAVFICGINCSAMQLAAVGDTGAGYAK